jgi:hypothetical protein
MQWIQTRAKQMPSAKRASMALTGRFKLRRFKTKPRAHATNLPLGAL